MTPQEFQTYLNHQRLEIEATNRIADALEQIALCMETSSTKVPLRIADAIDQITRLVETMLPAKAPDVVFDLSSWATFDWSSIGATVTKRDASGPTVVSWRGQPFFRRSPNNKFTAAIWFSRCTGKDDQGENTYERLCTFKSLNHLEVEPLPDKVAKVATRP